MCSSECSTNLIATALSTVFDKNVKFEIGQNEFVSSGSRLVFFNLGRTIEDFRLFGKMPSSSYMLHIFAIVSAKSGRSCLLSHVGAGSSRQCFEGEAPMIFEISSADTGLNHDRVVICLGLITGGMASEVASQIFSILFWKKSANSSAANVLSDVVFGGLRRTPIFDQSTDGSLRFDDNVLDQCSTYCSRRTYRKYLDCERQALQWRSEAKCRLGRKEKVPPLSNVIWLLEKDFDFSYTDYFACCNVVV